ncbi:MAG: hypothetical protein ACRDTM_06275 [Micromonosporaceae bacterium]
MSSYERIYLYTGGMDIKSVGIRIAEVIGAEITHNRSGTFVTRAMISVPEGQVWGEVEENIFYENPPSVEHPSVIDLYDARCSLRCSPRPDEFQEREAAKIFDEITQELPWPAVLTHADGDLLASAWAAKLGRTDFPPGTTPDEEDHELWRPYADPATLTQPHD